MFEEDITQFIYSLKGKKKGGHLNKWCQCRLSKGHIIGIVTGSPQYKDNVIIRCSQTVEIHTVKGKTVLETQNSYYYLETAGTEEELDQHYEVFYKDSERWFQ